MTGGPLRHEVRIEAPPDVVQRFFTDPARLVEWWPSEATIDPRPGGALRLRFIRPDGTADLARGEFVELSTRRIVFTWGFEGDRDLGPGRISRHLSVLPCRMSVLPIRNMGQITYLFHVKDAQRRFQQRESSTCL